MNSGRCKKAQKDQLIRNILYHCNRLRLTWKWHDKKERQKLANVKVQSVAKSAKSVKSDDNVHWFWFLLYGSLIFIFIYYFIGF